MCRFGFDTSHEELDGAIESLSYYAQARRELRLREYCAGYIYLRPVSRQRFVRPLHRIAATESDREMLRQILGDETQRRTFVSEKDAHECFGGWGMYWGNSAHFGEHGEHAGRILRAAV